VVFNCVLLGHLGGFYILTVFTDGSILLSGKSTWHIQDQLLFIWSSLFLGAIRLVVEYWLYANSKLSALMSGSKEICFAAASMGKMGFMSNI
jgi:hypothetical protein